MSRPDWDLQAYDFELPPELIAQRPAEPRDGSRLLVIDRARGTWEHRKFLDLPEYFGAQDLLVANNTRVIRARLLGRRLVPASRVGGSGGSNGTEALGGAVEFVLLDRVGPRRWEGLFKASARYVPGVRFEVPAPGGRIVGELTRGSADSPHGTVEAEFDRDPVEAGAGELPLPGYVERSPGTEDVESYQTIYSKTHADQSGSAAAPTAGLHFTPRVMEALRARGATWEELTLNVGLGTFRPVKTDDVRAHVMHEERYEVSASVAERVTAARRAGKRITAVGTTSVRTLESAWREGALAAGSGKTGIFIYPGSHEFQVVDRLLTNFHLPKSTLLMLVSAFAGRELALSAYREAVRQEYRFFSYGDAMLVI